MVEIPGRLEKVINKLSKHPLVFGAVFHVSRNESFEFSYAVGNMETNTPYYIASINKFMISAMVLQLIRNGKLSFETKLAEYLKEDEINGLLVFRGKDYSKQITTEHLLSHTSGLPGYLIDKQADGRMAMKELEAGIDQPWDIDKVIGTIKTMKPHFAPGTSGKAKYIDTNHHLLSLVINRVTGKTFQENLDPILEDLQIKDTFVFGSGIREFSTIYFRKYKRDITQFMSSTGIDIIATAEDQMKFLKAFFNGYFYPKEKLKQLEKWNGIFFPFEYGIGIQKVSIPRILSPFKAIPKIIGHSGSTGCLAFYIPEKDLYVTGTINQQAAPRLAFQTLFKIINAV